MAIWYFDPDGGDQSNDGQSFANRKKYCEYANRTQFGSGDEIRFIKSPDPTSLGNALWTTDAAQYNSKINTDNVWSNSTPTQSQSLHGSRSAGSMTASRLGTNPVAAAHTAHGLATGDTITIQNSVYDQGFTGAFEITKVDNDNFTLDGTELQTQRSVEFDGTDDALTTATSSDFDFGSGNFTVEAWIYPEQTSSENLSVVSLWNYNDNKRAWSISGVSGSASTIRGMVSPDGAWATRTEIQGTINQNQWNHVAFTRSSNTLYLFINGVSAGTASFSGSVYNNTSDGIMVGGQGAADDINNVFDGNISNVRVLKGTAVYTSAFTPSINRLTAITNTKLLCCNKPSTTESTITPGTITAHSSPTASTLNPFDRERSVDFDGTDDYLSVASSSDLTFGTGDFTVELWAYPDDFGSRGTFYDSRPSGGTDGITIGHEVTSGEIRVYMTATGGSDIVVQSSDFVTGQWQHIAVTRESGTVRLFINGVLKDTETRTTDLNNTNAVNIGYKTYTSSSYSYFDGKISNLRVVKGTAVYTSAFTALTEPLTNVTNTKFLGLNNSSITSATVTPGVITVHNSATASTLNPFTDFTGESKAYRRFSPFRALLATACTKNIIIYQSEGGIGDKDWTATLGTTYRENSYMQSGYRSARAFKPGTSGTGKAAYVELENALDLSGYQQISFSCIFDYLSSSQEDDDSVMSLRLCTDTTGDTSVHTIPITHGFDNSDDWYSVVHDFGTNLNASIQSVAIYVDTTLAHANTEVIIDNVIACKAKSSADSLTHASLISKGNTHNDVWYGLMAIDGKRLVLRTYGGDNTSGLFGSLAPYPGATETVTTYKRECFRRPTFRSTTERRHSPFFNIDEAGSIGDSSFNKVISGGWNTTDMSSQDTNSGTWFDCIHPAHYNGIYSEMTNRLSISKFGVYKGRAGILNRMDQRYEGRSHVINNLNCVSTSQGESWGPDFQYNNCVFSNLKFERDPQANDGSVHNSSVIFKDCTFYSASFDYASVNVFQYITLLNPTIRGTAQNMDQMAFDTLGRDIKVLGGSVNNIRWILNNKANMNKGGRFRMSNTLINNDSVAPIQGTEHRLYYDATHSGGAGGAVSNTYGENNDQEPATIINYNNVATDHRLYFFGAEVFSETSVRNTASGIAWKMRNWNVNNLNGRKGVNYVKWRFAETAVNASAQVTLTAYVRRSDTGFNLKLAALAEDNYHMGITSDVTVTASGSADAWEQLTLNVTPTAAGTITFTSLFSGEYGVYDASQVGYIDDIAITQA